MSANPNSDGHRREKKPEPITEEERAAERERKESERRRKIAKREAKRLKRQRDAAISSATAVSSGTVISSDPANSPDMVSPSGAVNSSVAVNPLGVVHIGMVNPGTVNPSGTANSSEPVNLDTSSPLTPIATSNASGKFSISSLLRSPLVVPSGNPVAIDEMVRILGAEDPVNHATSSTEMLVDPLTATTEAESATSAPKPKGGLILAKGGYFTSPDALAAKGGKLVKPGLHFKPNMPKDRPVEIKPATTPVPAPTPATAPIPTPAPAPVPIRIPVRIPVPAPPPVLTSTESIISALTTELAALDHTVIPNSDMAILLRKMDLVTENVKKHGDLLRYLIERLDRKDSNTDQDVEMD